MRVLKSAIIAVLLASPALAQSPTAYDGDTQHVRSGALTLSPEQERHYRVFKRGNAHFGAFSVARNGKGSFFSREFSNISTAKRAAQRGCEVVSKGPCALYAVALPNGVSLDDNSAAGLGYGASRAFTGVYQRHQRDGEYGAFAITGSSEYGYSHGWATPEEARATAMKFCNREVAITKQNILPAMTDWATSLSVLTCRIVDETGPTHD